MFSVACLARTGAYCWLLLFCLVINANNPSLKSYFVNVASRVKIYCPLQQYSASLAANRMLQAALLGIQP